MNSGAALKELRTRTGAGIVDCKKALDASGGDIEKAIVWLRQKGKAKAAKKATRATAEGYIGAYIHSNAKVATLVSLRCETDFVARNEFFQQLARDIAMHVAATDPAVVRPEDIPADLIAAERAVAQEQAKQSGKPVAIQTKMIAGKVQRFAEERALLTQPFVKDPTKTIADLINEAVATLGENVSIGGFSRLTV